MRLSPLNRDGSHRRDSLGREIALMLLLKLAIIFLIRHAFFSEPVLEKMTEGLEPARVAAVLASSPGYAVPTGLTFAAARPPLATPPTPESQP